MNIHRLKVPAFVSETSDSDEKWKKDSWASDSPTVLAREETEEQLCTSLPWILLPQDMCIPPPGYAHVPLLPGKTVRIRLAAPQYFSWAPGQHVLSTVLAVSRFQCHPFTISSACNKCSAGIDAQDIVLVIRAQNGFTKANMPNDPNLDRAVVIPPISRLSLPTGVYL